MSAEMCIRDRYMRLMADFQNYKRRSEKERSDIYSFANEKIVSELLAVADNFERALASVDKNESFVKGMEMIFNQLIGVMTKAGVEEIKALGEDFDPNFHNAVMAEESSEYESGKVTEVLQKGYILNGKVIRPVSYTHLAQGKGKRYGTGGDGGGFSQVFAAFFGFSGRGRCK